MREREALADKRKYQDKLAEAKRKGSMAVQQLHHQVQQSRERSKGAGAGEATTAATTLMARRGSSEGAPGS